MNRFLILGAIIMLVQIHLKGQASTNTTQFFDPKFTLRKNSVIQKDTGWYKLNNNESIKIHRISGDSVFIKMKLLSPYHDPDTASIEKIKHADIPVFFLISNGDYKLSFSDFDVSPLVIPLKVRPAIGENPLQFLGDVSVGPYFGYQRGTRTFDFMANAQQISWTVCAFGTPTLININPSNQQNNDVNSNSVLGLSAGAGILFDINSLQFGLVCGWDWISGDASTTWIYQGKPWTSFSFAYNLSNK